jgi:hypothetical protein
VKTRFKALQDAVLAHRSERSKRAIFNGIGSGMKWLFGVATTEQFTKCDGKLKKQTKESAKMTHLIRHQATLINESLWETRETVKQLMNISAAIETLTRQRASLENKVTEFAEEFNRRLILIVTTEEAFETVIKTIDSLEQYVDDLGIALASLAQGRLPPTLFPLDALRKVLLKISQALPRGWTLSTSITSGELWHFYQEAKVTTALTDNGLKLFIQFPLLETKSTFDLFQIIAATSGQWHSGQSIDAFTHTHCYF